MSLAVASIALLVLVATALAQTPDETGIETQGDTVTTSIAIEELPTASVEATDLIGDARESLLADSTLLAIAGLIPSASIRVDSLCVQSEDMLASHPSLRRLRNLQSDWQAVIRELQEWKTSLSNRKGDIGKEVEELARVKLEWQMTQDRAGRDRLPGEVLAQISRTISGWWSS